MIQKKELTDTSYLFVPFTYGRKGDFRKVSAAFEESGIWQPVDEEPLYLLKYISDRIDCRDSTSCGCFRYKLDPEKRSSLGLPEQSTPYELKIGNASGDEERSEFFLEDVLLYSFSTTVCIMAFRLCFSERDPLKISSALFHLKKVSKKNLHIKDSDIQPESLLGIAGSLLPDCNIEGGFTFFPFSNSGRERANVLTYVELPPKDNYNKELFYLRHCYDERYDYCEKLSDVPEEIHIQSKIISWGITNEATACIACPERSSTGFVEFVFRKNFNKEYLFMYVLLLHQKYVLYSFMTRIGTGMQNDLEKLEEYRLHLYEFETDFVFSTITEVPQYQSLYVKISKAFGLKQMYDDVHEPLISLSEMRRSESEKKREKRDKSVNTALIMLSVLSFFSALIDSVDFADSFLGLFMGAVGIWIVKSIFIGAIVCVTIYVIITLIGSGKKR